ncbi:glycosyltransferase [Actinomadura sp. 7K507]|uniref:MGDG synthase family glycosyltransferase n=1 Tax=Actinomadura sp. 7K507 TaxID=2530365 RepID=UPI0010517902|nr:glycosyltransferase [Actinomadura sp. 7K507]TDC79591.1 glycosyltransferase [Actinomadura sp. 7K507]
MTTAVTRPDPPAHSAAHSVPPARVLLLTADTGGGHRASTEALREELAHRYGAQVTSVALDPLTGPAAPRPVAGIARLYGPLVRHAPFVWGPLFHGTDIGPVRRLLSALVTRAVRRPLAEAFAHHDPDVVAVLHPLLVAPATAARRGHHARVVSVVTDLGRPHGTWWHPDADHLVAPRPGLARKAAGASRPTAGEHLFGLPVRRQFTDPGVSLERDRARRRLGLDPGRFVVMVNGGGEGSRGTGRWARALVTGPADVDVLVVCGRNERLRRRLARLTPPAGRRLIVTGFVDDMAARMSAADVLVTKAGPGIIAEAAALGLPLLVAGHLPGQEAGNREHVVRAGAGLAVDSTRDLAAAAGRLRADPVLLHRLREGARRAGRPDAAALTTDLIMTLAKEVR